MILSNIAKARSLNTARQLKASTNTVSYRHWSSQTKPLLSSSARTPSYELEGDAANILTDEQLKQQIKSEEVLYSHANMSGSEQYTHLNSFNMLNQGTQFTTAPAKPLIKNSKYTSSFSAANSLAASQGDSADLGLIACGAFKEYRQSEKDQVNFSLQMMRQFYGRSYESRKYLSKRKLREQAFQRNLESHMSQMYDQDPQGYLDSQKKHFSFSDDENEYNYYTDSDEEFDKFAEQQFSKLRAFAALLFPLLMSAGVGVVLAKQQAKKNECWFGSSSDEKKSEAPKPSADKTLKPGEVFHRVQAVQYESNSPIEDRLSCSQFKNLKNAYCVAVFDGHGGWQVAEKCQRNLHDHVDENLKGAKTETEIKNAISKAFDQVEEEWLQVAKLAFDAGYPKTAYVGACALMAVIHENKIYVANSGDCKGVLLREKADGTYDPINVNRAFSANKTYEQERLTKQFKNEKDVFVCKRGDPKACYVKGGLQPSRAIGDVRLKHREFNFHQHSPEHGYRKPIPQYTGPYITHVPEIQVFELTKDDKWLILATDGLWDEVSRKKTAAITRQAVEDEKNEPQENVDRGTFIVKKLLYSALQRASRQAGISRDFLAELPPGQQKRQIVDDITILVVDLENSM